MRKVDIPDDLAIAVERVRVENGLRTFTAAVHFALTKGCNLVLNGAAPQPTTPPEPKPAIAPVVTPAPVAVLSERSSTSRADRLKRL